MYFAVIGNFPEITLAELKLIDARGIKKVWKHLIVFDTSKEDRISDLASLVKWWKIISVSELSNYAWDKKICWNKLWFFSCKYNKRTWTFETNL